MITARGYRKQSNASFLIFVQYQSQFQKDTYKQGRGFNGRIKRFPRYEEIKQAICIWNIKQPNIKLEVNCSNIGKVRK